MASLVANNGNFGQTVDALRQQAELDGEPVMEALALALGSWDEIGGGDPEAAVATDADLGARRSFSSWRRASTNATPTRRASAHIAAAVSYGYRRLWELEDEQYQRAESVLLPGEEKFLRAVVLFNRAELQMKWACALREIDEQDDIELHCQLGRQAVQAAQSDRHAPDLAHGVVSPRAHVRRPHRRRRVRTRGRDGSEGPDRTTSSLAI